MSGGLRNLGIAVRKAREARHLGRFGLAERVGISLDALESIERGEAGCSADLLYKIAQAVGMRLDLRFRPVDAPPDSTICHECFVAMPGSDL